LKLEAIETMGIFLVLSETGKAFCNSRKEWRSGKHLSTGKI
jgi:hypothetical protein